MKVRITFKTPYVVGTVVDEARDNVMRTQPGSLEEEAAEAELDMLDGLIRKFFRHDEYVTVELDTESGTCVAVPVNG